MANSRATKSGLAAEAHAKINSKYDPELANQVMCWIQGYVTDPAFSTDGSMDSVYETLADGYILRRLIQELNGRLGSGGANKAPKKQTMAFKKMEEINQFLQAISAAPYGVPSTELFQTVDLYEKQNMSAVITCLASLARKAQKNGLQGFGPKEAEANKRDFTDEQLKAGSGVIGLQMGSNKGASQAGQNFGKGRGIYDTKAQS